MNEQIMTIKLYLENAYTGARAMNDAEGMIRIARALAALQADTERDIFTEEYEREWIMNAGFTAFDKV